MCLQSQSVSTPTRNSATTNTTVDLCQDGRGGEYFMCLQSQSVSTPTRNSCWSLPRWPGRGVFMCLQSQSVSTPTRNSCWSLPRWPGRGVFYVFTKSISINTDEKPLLTFAKMAGEGSILCVYKVNQYQHRRETLVDLCQDGRGGEYFMCLQSQSVSTPTRNSCWSLPRWPGRGVFYVFTKSISINTDEKLLLIFAKMAGEGSIYMFTKSISINTDEKLLLIFAKMAGEGSILYVYKVNQYQHRRETLVDLCQDGRGGEYFMCLQSQSVSTPTRNSCWSLPRWPGRGVFYVFTKSISINTDEKLLLIFAKMAGEGSILCVYKVNQYQHRRETLVDLCQDGRGGQYLYVYKVNQYQHRRETLVDLCQDGRGGEYFICLQSQSVSTPTRNSCWSLPRWPGRAVFICLQSQSVSTPTRNSCWSLPRWPGRGVFYMFTKSISINTDEKLLLIFAKMAGGG